MSDDANRDRDVSELPLEPSRKPYRTPAIVSEEVFETLALSCAKNGSPIDECDFLGSARS